MNKLRPNGLLSLGERIEQRLSNIGVELPRQPSGSIPDLPEDLTNVTSRDVGRLLTEFCSWLSFLTPRVALAKVTYKEAKANFELAKKRKVGIEELEILQQALLEADAYASVLEGVEKATLRKKEAASREISRLTDTGVGRDYHGG
mgnify:CR=1 FL=1